MADQSNVAAKGSLWKAKNKTNPKGPDYTGSVTTQAPIPAGTKLYFGAWVNTNDQGEKYFSVNLTFPLQPQQPQAQGYPSRNYQGQNSGYAQQQPPMDDDIPF